MDGFEETLLGGWAVAADEKNPFPHPILKLKSTACQLMSWSEKQIGCIRFQLMMAREIIFRFDVAMKFLLLSELEQKLCTRQKHAYLGLASVECSMARQRSNIAWLAEGMQIRLSFIRMPPTASKRT